MFYQLMDLALKHKEPVAIHTGLQAGKGNIIGNSNPVLLTNIFKEYPGINFVLYHGSYPFGGELSTLAKNYRNVYIDMNWVWSISPSYTERYLNEWLETVPVSRIMAFGGDAMVVENVYSELKIAKRIISDVLCNKVRNGYITEPEAKIIAKMILHDNAAKLYNLH
jgi:predicted TIM-barrel fold metal-dependent hydrolase